MKITIKVDNCEEVELEVDFGERLEQLLAGIKANQQFIGTSLWVALQSLSRAAGKDINDWGTLNNSEPTQ